MSPGDKRPVNWVRLYFVASVVIFVITALLFFFAAWEIAGTARHGSRGPVYGCFVESMEVGLAACFLFLALGGLPLALLGKRRLGFVPVALKHDGERRVDWMRLCFVASLAIFVIAASLIVFAPWEIGGAYRHGSWQETYWYFVESNEVALTACVSFLALMGFALAFLTKGRLVLAAVAFAAVLLGLIAAPFALRAVN